MKKAKTAAAVFFLATLGVCLTLVLTGVVRVGTGRQKPVAVSRYAPGAEGVTYRGLVDWFEDTCQGFCTTELPGRMVLQEANARINRAAGKWIFESTSPEVVRLKNGYLESIGNFYYYLTQADQKVTAFDAWVAENLDCPYLYVQAPCKLCAREEDQLPFPEMTNNNQQADWLLERIAPAGVDCLDLRENLHQDGLDHYGCFYATDHHWTMDAGLWAARTLAEELNHRYGLDMDTAVLAEENFGRRVWADAFLGSQGRRVTTVFAQPEDFILPVPRWEPALRLRVPGPTPETSLDRTGGFEILYNAEKIVPEDYYNGNSYGAVLQGDCPYLVVENRDNPDGPVIAVLRESFAIAPGPYLSLAAGELHLIDARYYGGSVKDLLQEIQPHAVLSLLNVQCHTGAYFDQVR